MDTAVKTATDGFTPARSGPHRPADGGGGPRCAGRYLEAQRAVSAGRLPLHLLLGDGCDRAQPLPAGGGLSAGRPDQAAYIGNRMEGGEHANRPFWTPTVLPACWGSVDAARRRWRIWPKIGCGGADRDRAGVPAGRCLAVLAAGLGEDRLRRCDGHAGADARDQDAGRAGPAAPGVRADHRFDAGHDGRGARGLDQAPRSSRSCAGRKRRGGCISTIAC